VENVSVLFNYRHWERSHATKTFATSSLKQSFYSAIGGSPSLLECVGFVEVSLIVVFDLHWTII